MAVGNPFTVEVHGLDELERALQILGEEVAGKSLRSALRAGMKPIREAAQARIPVGSKPHYIGRKAKGKLVQPGFLQTQLRAPAVETEEFSGMIALTFSGNGFYAMFMEFGTAKMPARPILRPAFDAQKVAALGAFMKSLERAVKRAQKRAAQGASRAGR